MNNNGKKWVSLRELGVHYAIFASWKRKGWLQEGIHYKIDVYEHGKIKGEHPRPPKLLLNTEFLTPEWVKEHYNQQPPINPDLTRDELLRVLSAHYEHIDHTPNYLKNDCKKYQVPIKV